MKKLMWLVVAAGIVAAPAWTFAKEKAAAGTAAGAKAELKELTVVGTITKEEKTAKSGKAMTVYTLTDKDGVKVVLHAGKKADAASDPAGFVGQNVTVVGQGEEQTSAKGKKTIRIEKITSIKKVE